jgi:hypothetical protein
VDVTVGEDRATDLTAEVDLEGPPRETDLHDPQQRVEVEAALRSVPGVIGARLVPGFERPIDELHVLTSLDKSPKQAVRDTQTVLMARFGVTTDHRVISVVQLDERTALGTANRVAIDGVSVAHRGLTVTAEVTLRDGDEQLVGTAEGSAAGNARHRAVASAALDAVGPLLGEGRIAELDGVSVSEFGGNQVAVALLHLRSDRSQQQLAGCAVVRDDTPGAVARAVLDALNRTIADADR